MYVSLSVCASTSVSATVHFLRDRACPCFRVSQCACVSVCASAHVARIGTGVSRNSDIPDRETYAYLLLVCDVACERRR